MSIRVDNASIERVKTVAYVCGHKPIQAALPINRSVQDSKPCLTGFFPTSLTDINLKEEYAAYQKYESSPRTGLKKITDEFVQSLGDPTLDNYKTRFMVLSFLYLRARAHDKHRARNFLENLITLKTKCNINGVDRLLKAALKNERANLAEGNIPTPHGFYRQAAIALNLVQKPNLKVESVSQ